MPDQPTDPNGAAPAGLSEAEAARRVAAAGSRPVRSDRSYLSIVRANVFTVFNGIIAAFGVLTLIFGDPQDALFLGVIVANSGIGITQEVRAKRTLDRLSLLVAPAARVRRDGAEREVPVGEVAEGDLVLLAAGDQLVADGELVRATDLLLDEAMLTGEAEPIPRETADAVRSGAFVVEGTGAYRVTSVGADSFAARITGEARSFRHERSPLERAVNRLLYVMVGLVVVLGTVLGYSLSQRALGTHAAVSTATAGVVTLVPEGLMVLVSLTYAVGAMRMSSRGVLAQQLNAIESLASVDTICVDKTGTLTEGTLRVVEIVPADGIDAGEAEALLAGFAASASAQNITLRAIADAYPADRLAVAAEVPFASRRRWSALQLPSGALYVGAPGRIPVGSLSGAAEVHQDGGRRVLAVARSTEPLPEKPGDEPPPGLAPVALVVLAESLRPNVAETMTYLRAQGIEVKVLSGDDPRTVAAIARDVGLPVHGVTEGSEIPDDAAARRTFALGATVVGRISPEGKKAIVEAIAGSGRYVAMLGDGVNDVPALKAARLSIGQGSGTQMARSVSDLVLVSGDFGAVPALVEEGRRSLRNLQRVARLYLSKSAFAAFLIVTIGIGSDAYPLLPRQLSLAASLTIGIPTFVLALAPSSGPWRPDHFAREAARFAAPAGFMTGAGILGGYLFAVHSLHLPVMAARTVATTALVIVGLYLVLVLESGTSRLRSKLVAGLCAVMGIGYLVAWLVPFVRHFFALSVPSVSIVLTAAGGSAFAIGAMIAAGMTLAPAPEGQPVALRDAELTGRGRHGADELGEARADRAT